MTEHRRQWLEKWGALTAIVSVLTVAGAFAVHIAVIAQWTGKLETKTEANCRKVDEIEKSLTMMPDRYVVKDDYVRRWDNHMKKEAEERIELMSTFDRLDRKLDKLMDIELGKRK